MYNFQFSGNVIFLTNYLHISLVKKAPIVQHPQPRTITIRNTAVPQTECNNSSSSSQLMALSSLTSPDVREIARQLKRIADVKAEKLRFEIARFKFNNPGFVYHSPTL